MPSDDEALLGAATRLAMTLAGEAIWHESRCNWIGALSADPARRGLAAAALGPELYAGTAGVAMFLAETARAAPQDGLRAAALGALRHALGHAQDIDPTARDGLYGGMIGIAYAAARVAHALGDEESLMGARALLAGWSAQRVPSIASDMSSGAAGAIAGLVALAALLDEPCRVETAVLVGEELLGQARPGRPGLCWPLLRPRGRQAPCGYLHGTAGCGYALLELWRVTGDGRFRDAAAGALAYTRSWLDPAAGVWPDLRGVASRVARRVALPGDLSWCQGGAGIAVAHVRAGALADPLATEAALGGARAAVGADDPCLCHGACGAADVLLYADDRSGLARRLALDRLEYPWRQGPPGLLPGLAGIGLFLLRAAAPGVPSALAIHA